ncbi:MAG: hypothetical protein K0B11_17750 [Mariniphaga sp.]|nr:hypothetical protein [Mariniphaga sp.]
MNELFNWCVEFLVWLADLVGMTYEEVNIWIFVIIEPLVFVLMLWVIIRQRRKFRKIQIQQLKDVEKQT